MYDLTVMTDLEAEQINGGSFNLISQKAIQAQGNIANVISVPVTGVGEGKTIVKQGNFAGLVQFAKID